MGTHYDQLSSEERLKIYHWHANGRSNRAIANELGRSPATIGRELQRNGKPTKQWTDGYDPLRANQLAQRRRRWDKRHKLARQPALRELVRDRLAMGWSPEQIAGRLAQAQGSTVISHEAIYRYIYHRSAQKDYWHRMLPRAKSRRGRLGRKGGSPALLIKQRVPIASRPDYIGNRSQPGHWEADLMLFSKYGQVILVAHERTSRCLILSQQAGKQAASVAQALTDMLKPLPQPLRQSITFDNGTEFAYHYSLKETLGIQTFFCDPHKPWQKGGVENAINRMRRTLPRKTDLATLQPGQLQTLVIKYNQTPRKCLGYKTPKEVFTNACSTVALQT